MSSASSKTALGLAFAVVAIPARIIDRINILSLRVDEMARRVAMPDAALEQRDVATVIVVARTGADVPMKDGRDVAYSELRDQLPHELLRVRRSLQHDHTRVRAKLSDT